MKNSIGFFMVSVRNWIYIFLIISFSPLNLFALDPQPSIHQYVLNEWTTENNLPFSSITSIVQTSDGNLWLSSPRSLCKFDGSKFTSLHRFNVSRVEYSRITKLKVDPGGLFWGGTQGNGLFQFKAGLFELYSKKNGLSSDFINCIFNDMKDRLWIGTDDGYLDCLIDKKKITFNNIENKLDFPIYSLCEDSKGNLWVGTKGGGLYRFQNKNFIKFDGNYLDEYDIFSICDAKTGDILFGTNHGVVKYNGQNVQIIGREIGLTEQSIYTIIEDSHNNLWLGSTNGLYRLQIGKLGTFYNIEKALTGIVINSIFEDREKSIWIGTDGNGLKRLSDSKIRTFSVDQGLPHDYVLYMYEDQTKNIWIGTMAGIVKFERGRLENQFMEVKYSDAVVGPICEDENGEIWFGTYGKGLFQIKNNKFIRYTTKNGLLSNSIIVLFNDSNNGLWIGTENGLNYLRKNGRFKSFTKEDGMSNNSIQCIFEDSQNRIWIGTANGIKLFKEGKFFNLNDHQPISDFIVSYIYEDNSDIFWIATKGSGLLRIKNNKIESFTTQNGLLSNYLYQIFEDNKSNLWISCDKGIFKIQKNALMTESSTQTIKINSTSFGKEDGMKTEECSRWGQHSSIRTHTGLLLFGTPRGISIIDPENIRIEKLPTLAKIEKIVYNNKLIVGDNFEIKDKSIEFIIFFFRAQTLLSQEKLEYKYILEGYDKDWKSVKSNQAKIAHYTDLPPGQYKFNVIACNRDGIWNTEGDTISFTYVPYFYYSNFFKIVVFIFCLITLFLVYFLLKKVKTIFKLRKRYKDSPLDPDKASLYLNELLDLMKTKKIFKEENLSLHSLASMISISPHVLSQLINERMDKNFSDYINSYRIEEAKRMLLDPKSERLSSILYIGYEVGFKSKSAFYQAFKKFTDMTPMHYRKKST